MRDILPGNKGAVISATAVDINGVESEFIIVRTEEDSLQWMSVGTDLAWFYSYDIIDFEVLFEGVPS